MSHSFSIAANILLAQRRAALAREKIADAMELGFPAGSTDAKAAAKAEADVAYWCGRQLMDMGLGCDAKEFFDDRTTAKIPNKETAS